MWFSPNLYKCLMSTYYLWNTYCALNTSCMLDPVWVGWGTLLPGAPSCSQGHDVWPQRRGEDEAGTEGQWTWG